MRGNEREIDLSVLSPRNCTVDTRELSHHLTERNPWWCWNGMRRLVALIERSDHDEQSTLVNREPRRAVAGRPSLVDGFQRWMEGRGCYRPFCGLTDRAVVVFKVLSWRLNHVGVGIDGPDSRPALCRFHRREPSPLAVGTRSRGGSRCVSRRLGRPCWGRSLSPAGRWFPVVTFSAHVTESPCTRRSYSRKCAPSGARSDWPTRPNIAPPGCPRRLTNSAPLFRVGQRTAP